MPRTILPNDRLELEDLAELAPEALDESYEQITALARRVLAEALPKVRSASAGSGRQRSKK